MSKWKYTNNDGKHIINNERGVLIAMVCDEDVAIRMVAEHQENERLRKELEEKERESEEWRSKYVSKVNLLRITDDSRNELDRMYREALEAAHGFQQELEVAQQAMSEPHKNLWFKWTNERNRSEEARTEAIYLARKLEEERKQSAAVRKAMQDVLYYLQRDSLVPAQDILEQYLAMSVGQEGEGNQDA
ncbi:hypothetical protein HP548_00615 [Paenibacillus taichungensis]|uniref:Uncharacterized protein n=1 Tax=Paenibacillus taichungensis TaxID=484184 RepID=A0ABX2MCD6_9BACL|nr:hypothetical protein [Paenibacillus taichungensis]NUU52613.1 hypothetical protein [Paenibacillus taichungensis]